MKRRRISLDNIVELCVHWSSEDNESLDSDAENTLPQPDHQSPNEIPTSPVTETIERRRSRKRLRWPSTWRRNVIKSQRAQGLKYVNHSGKIVIEKTMGSPCGEACRMKCYEAVIEENRENIFSDFYEHSSEQQDQLLASLIEETTKLRERMRIDSHNASRRRFTRKYYLLVEGQPTEVCLPMFCATFGISRKKARVISERKRLSGSSNIIPKDKRGRHGQQPKIAEVDLDNIRDHIKMFPAYESHYSREKSAKKYLNPHLSIEHMYRLYEEHCEAKNIPPQKSHLYRKIFVEEFNLSFHPPASDTCEKCDAFKASLIDATNEEKVQIEQARSAHHAEAELAYSLKRNDKIESSTSQHVVTASFDLQKVLQCPFIQTGIAFYKRQLAVCNSTVYETHNNKSRSICYMWDQTIAGRGSQEIGSCLLRYIDSLPSSVKDVRLWSDSCGGQNRNMQVSAMHMSAAASRGIKITQRFLIPGHTHMEADTIHAAIERQKKATNSIIEIPRDWYNIVRSIPRKPRIQVVEMHQDHFKNSKNLFQGPLVKRKHDIEGKPVNWLTVRELQYNSEAGIFTYRSSFDSESAPCAVDFRRKAKGRPLLWNLESLYNEQRPVPSNVLTDLQDLLPYISRSSQYFYQNLTAGEAVDE